MMLRPQKFVLVCRRFFRIYKGIKSSQQHASKLCRIVSNSGYLVAGCCFSRQSDEDYLLPEARKHLMVNTNIKAHDQMHFNVNTKDDRKSKNMKRSPGFINNVVSQDSNVGEIPVEAYIHNKKRKIVAEETENDADTEIKLSKVASDTLSCVVEPSRTEKREFPKTETKELPDRLRPNYFVAFKISNQEIHANLRNLQNHILEKEYNLKRSMTELKTLHITLMVMYIGDAETHARAMKALESIHQEHDKDMSDNPLQLQFKGLGHFRNRVLYAKPCPDDSYERLCNLSESVKQHFADNLIFTTDKRSEFTPHLTVTKIDFQKKQNKFIKKIDPWLYKEYNDQYFGSQIIESIQLLRMTGPKNEEGYYFGDEIYFSPFDPNHSMNALCKSLEIDKKKEDIKEAINSIMRRKFK